MTPTRRYGSLAVSIALVAAVAAAGSLFTADAVPSWYADLARPSWAPPNWLFGPVWTALYLMMAAAAWLVYLKGGLAPNRAALGLYGLQLALNAIWTPLFFGLRMPGVAFAEIILMWLAILATMLLFFRIRKAGGWLLLPYLCWVTFASFLNFAIWRLN